MKIYKGCVVRSALSNNKQSKFSITELTKIPQSVDILLVIKWFKK